MKQIGVYKLEGVLQHYQWGGTDFLPTLLQRDNDKKEPWAEYWLGVHPKGTALVSTTKGKIPLTDLLDQHPDYLGKEIQHQFGELPFLLKILDVREMLSIQLHPTRAAAQKGFEQEEKAGVPRLAPQRNYKDTNHKPEVMVALSDFWLLHGFRTAQAIAATLQEVPQWQQLVPILEAKGVAGLYEHVMTMTDEAAFSLLDPLYQELSENHQALTPDSPNYWAWQAFQQYSQAGYHDRGIFSIYWFNLVYLAKDEGIFQGAGIPHAYLRGINVELMANSDNVLRGGLTPKHIDVKELLANINFAAVTPQIIKGEATSEVAVDYPVPVPDFALNKYELSPEQHFTRQQNGPGIYLVLTGEICVNDQFFKQGEAFFVTNKTLVRGENKGAINATIFAAIV